MKEALKGGPVILLAFGLLLAVHTCVMFAFSGSDTIMFALLGGTAVASVLAAAFALARRGGDERVQALPDLSLATVAVAFGLALALIGLHVGPWLCLVGGGVLAFGLGGLVREGRARPR